MNRKTLRDTRAKLTSSRYSRRHSVRVATGFLMVAILLLPLSLSDSVVRGQALDVIPFTSGDDLVNTLLGNNNILISNVVFTGAPAAAGKFTGGAQAIGFDNGILLTSGNIQNVKGPNNSTSATQGNGAAGDADLDAIVDPEITHDATALEFDFMPTRDTIAFQYVFASEEYREFVCAFNDVFGFFVSNSSTPKTNVALLPDNTPVAIDSVNNGSSVQGSETCPPRNAQFFRDNDKQDGTAPFGTQMDGLTTVLTVTATVLPNQVNHIKLVIADTRDFSLDSAVFIRANSFVDDPCAIDSVPPSIACPGNVNFECISTTGPKYTLPTVTDNCPDPNITCFPPPDFNFGPGTTIVNCEAIDQAGNNARCSFTVTIGDNTSPTITSCPGAVTIQNSPPACAVPVDITNLVSATDNCTPAPLLLKTQIPAKMTALAAGTTHNVAVVVRDTAGKESTCFVAVTIPPGPASAVTVTPATVELGSIKLFAAKKKKKVKPTAVDGPFTVTINGCTALSVTPKAITRVEDAGKMNPDDSTFFKVTNVVTGAPFTGINFGDPPAQLKVTFNPTVPALSSCGNQPPSPSCLNAANVLPSSFTSVMSFNGTNVTVTFKASVAKGVKLLDETNTSAANGVAQLCRSGDQFTVVYFIYDSDTSDVKSVKYEFLDDAGGVVKVIDSVDLAGPIGKAGLVNGMSFRVQQTFSGASDNDNVTKVRVTVTGAAGSTSTAESSGNSNCGSTTQAFLERRFTTVLLPARKLRAVTP